jgi:hypothetical protein
MCVEDVEYPNPLPRPNSWLVVVAAMHVVVVAQKTQIEAVVASLTTQLVVEHVPVGRKKCADKGSVVAAATAPRTHSVKYYYSTQAESNLIRRRAPTVDVQMLVVVVVVQMEGVALVTTPTECGDWLRRLLLRWRLVAPSMVAVDY